MSRSSGSVWQLRRNKPSPAALNPAWAPIVTSGLSMERGRSTFGVVYISLILGRRARFEISKLCFL